MLMIDLHLGTEAVTTTNKKYIQSSILRSCNFGFAYAKSVIPTVYTETKLNTRSKEIYVWSFTCQ